jgi:hypothetical protein
MHKDEKGIMRIKNLVLLFLLVFAGSVAAQTNDEIRAKTAEFAVGGSDASAHLYHKHGFVPAEEKVTENFGITATEQKYELTL